MATKRELSIRLGVEGGAQVKNDFRDLGATGKQAFDAIGKAGTAASENLDQLDKKLAATAGQARQTNTAVQQQINAAVGIGQTTAPPAARSADVFRYQAAQQAAQQAAAVQAAQAQFNALLGVGTGTAGSAAASAAVFEAAEQAAQQERAALQQLGAQARSLIEQHDLLAAAERRYAESVETTNAALAQGVISSEQHQKVLAGEKAQLDSVRQAAERAAKGGFSLNSGSIASLRAAGVNYFQGVSSGIDPLIMLQTEAAQVIGAIVQGGSGITASMVVAGGAVAGLAAGLGALALAYSKGSGEAQEFARVQKLTANAAGLTADSLEAIVSASTAAGDIGPATARSIATAMAATGKESADVIAKLTAIVGDYAKATKQSTDEAGADLASTFADPAQGDAKARRGL